MKEVRFIDHMSDCKLLKNDYSPRSIFLFVNTHIKCFKPILQRRRFIKLKIIVKQYLMCKCKINYRLIKICKFHVVFFSHVTV